MTEVAYNRYDEAYKAIHSALMNLTFPPPGRKLTKLAFTWNADGTLATLQAYDGADLLFTLAFTWNVEGTLKEVART
jgi:beta-mannanase